VAIYLSSSAQAELYQHLDADFGGRCLMCHELEPCRRRRELHEALLRNGFLPRREPGRTRAGLVRRV
jgi:hypothetical protein